MVSIQGIGGIPEPANSRQTHGRNRTSSATPPAKAGDDVQISSAASQAAQAVAQTSGQSEVREERIAQARENIEQGVYRIQEVVLQVAGRISKFVY